MHYDLIPNLDMMPMFRGHWRKFGKCLLTEHFTSWTIDGTINCRISKLFQAVVAKLSVLLFITSPNDPYYYVPCVCIPAYAVKDNRNKLYITKLNIKNARKIGELNFLFKNFTTTGWPKHSSRRCFTILSIAWSLPFSKKVRG